MAADFFLKRHDRNPPLARTLSDANGPIDLTGATVRLHVRPSPPDGTLKVDADCAIVDAAAGRVSYAWQAADVDTAGLFYAEFQVTFGDGTTLTIPNDRHLQVLITDDLA